MKTSRRPSEPPFNRGRGLREDRVSDALNQRLFTHFKTGRKNMKQNRETWGYRRIFELNGILRKGIKMPGGDYVISSFTVVCLALCQFKVHRFVLIKYWLFETYKCSPEKAVAQERILKKN
jgi:hypothetical protein